MIDKMMVLFPSGRHEFIQIQGLSLDDISRQLPEGVYTTFRTYQKTKALDLDSHFSRLENSASILEKGVTLNWNILRNATRDFIDQFATGDLRIRIIVSLEPGEWKVFLFGEPLIPLPFKIYERGAKAVLVKDIYRVQPLAKSTGFISMADVKRRGLPLGVNEALMISREGEILEGLSSNFFSVLDRKIWTAGSGILEGITRSLVLRCIDSLGVEVITRGIKVSDLPVCTECFITSASRGILPIVQVDDIIIKNGNPGTVTRDLSTKFNDLIQSEIKEI